MALCLDMTRRMPTRGYVVALLVLGLAGAAGCNPVNRGGWTRETVDVPGDLYAVRALRNDRQLAVGDGSTTLANGDASTTGAERQQVAERAPGVAPSFDEVATIFDEVWYGGGAPDAAIDTKVAEQSRQVLGSGR